MVPLDQLMAIGPLPDIVQGAVNAPSTIVEYASVTCTHCAAFHETVWPDLKAKYVDSGRAKFILREFPLDPLATAGFMLARCSGPDKRNLLVDQLFAQQKDLGLRRQADPAACSKSSSRRGCPQTDFETCLKNQELYSGEPESRHARPSVQDQRDADLLHQRPQTGRGTDDRPTSTLAASRAK